MLIDISVHASHAICHGTFAIARKIDARSPVSTHSSGRFQLVWKINSNSSMIQTGSNCNRIY